MLDVGESKGHERPWNRLPSPQSVADEGVPVAKMEGSLSPRSFALRHQRPQNSFTGCSKISEYEILGKLGEGTFG